jgi:hypothetical protein
MRSFKGMIPRNKESQAKEKTFLLKKAKLLVLFAL